MLSKKLYTILISCLIIFLLGLIIHEKVFKVSYVLSEYEYKLLSYFNEVALNSEHSDNPHRVIKWKEPMILFISKDEDFDIQMKSIYKTINNINELATDDFRIELTNDILKCNAILYLCNKERLSELNYDFYKELSDDIDYEISGLAYVEFSWETYIIDKAFIYIDTEDPINVQESTILEELTQSIGLLNDSMTYSNSIFYKNKTGEKNVLNEYTKMDVDVIRLLYHSKMEPGLNFTQVKKVIKKILGKEAGNTPELKEKNKNDIAINYETEK
jgi:hypothetical protein